ncbi:MAG: hypothetical protein ACJZ16_05370 [Methylophilaceae bacterium]|tara:strand:- start:254 stop:424 length:171 start_codon:yes stop_codon:yes gene_type:complete
MERYVAAGEAFATGFLLTTVIIYALFFMMEESTPNPLKILCGLVGGTGIFIFLGGF